MLKKKKVFFVKVISLIIVFVNLLTVNIFAVQVPNGNSIQSNKYTIEHNIKNNNEKIEAAFLVCVHDISLVAVPQSSTLIKFNILNSCYPPFLVLPCSTPVYYTFTFEIRTPYGNLYNYKTRSGSAYPGIVAIEEVSGIEGYTCAYSVSYTLDGVTKDISTKYITF